jgi:5'-3' exonuclease
LLSADLVNLADIDIKFDLGTPFLPLQQLLGVLPPGSRRFLPAPYQRLMIDADSPLNHYYPLDFPIDLNGKKHDWEAIALIPFIDEKLLLDACNAIPQGEMKAEEKKRNMFGSSFNFVFDANAKETYKTTLPGLFPDVVECNSRMDDFNLPMMPDGVKNNFSLMAATKIGVNVPAGLPTMKTLSHRAVPRYLKVNLFGNPSKKDTLMILLNPTEKKVQRHLKAIETDERSGRNELDDDDMGHSQQDIDDDDTMKPDIADFARKYLHKSCFVWPYHREAFVTQITSEDGRWSENGSFAAWRGQEMSQWYKESLFLRKKYLSSKGVDVGTTWVLVHVRFIEGVSTRSVVISIVSVTKFLRR